MGIDEIGLKLIRQEEALRLAETLTTRLITGNYEERAKRLAMEILSAIEAGLNNSS